MSERTADQGARGRTPRPRGFAAMDPQLQRAIASRGGRAAHEQGTAHEFTSAEAREAGRKGGQASARRRGQSGEGEGSLH